MSNNNTNIDLDTPPISRLMTAQEAFAQSVLVNSKTNPFKTFMENISATISRNSCMGLHYAKFSVEGYDDLTQKRVSNSLRAAGYYIKTDGSKLWVAWYRE